MNLRDCLQKAPIRELEIIARLWQCYIADKPRKKQLVSHLMQVMRKATHLQRILEQLTSDERAALDALIANSGRLSWLTFRAQFGEIRPYTPWDKASEAHPWRHPISAAERLSHLGLIFRHPRRPKANQEVVVLIASDLLALLPKVKSPTEAAIVKSAAKVPHQKSFLLDIALFLSLLHREDISPLHKRWLPPKQIKALNQRFSLSEEVTSSELKTKRLRFLHFLAEAANLITLTGGCLKPNLNGWNWLNAPQAKRYQQLWQAQRNVSVDLWKRYRFPGIDEEQPVQLFNSLLTHLAQAQPSVPLALDTFSQQLEAQEPNFFAMRERFDSLKAGKNIIAFNFINSIIKGPLRWWGLLSLSQHNGQELITLTPLGHWLLRGQGSPPHSQTHPITIDQQLNITLPTTVALPTLMQIEFVAAWHHQQAGLRHYQITQKSLARASRRGLTLSQLLDQLEQASRTSLSDAQRHQLISWSDDIQQVQLHQLTILETSNAAQMQQLTANRTLNNCLERSLSSRAVVVKEAAIERVQRALNKQGIETSGMPHQRITKKPFDEGHHAQALLTGIIYQALSQWIALPQRLFNSSLNEIALQLSPSTRTIIQQAAKQTIEQLKQVIDGYPARRLQGIGLPQEQSLPIIQQAINISQDLQITYWSAGRNVRTERQIEPQQLQWRGKTAYLIAHCHQAQAERKFRLDRIEELTLIPRQRQEENQQRPEWEWKWG